MIRIRLHVFNPFQVNTYVLYDESGEAVIIDPACYEPAEEKELEDFIRQQRLRPVKLLYTHAHIDHILGNNFIALQFGLSPQLHEAGLPFFLNAAYYAGIYGFRVQPMVPPGEFLCDGQLISFGNSSLKVLYTPGHADGSLCFYAAEEGFVVTGDLIFYESVGRYDLPTGNEALLFDSIRRNILTLPPETLLYPGHGHETTVAHEKSCNPFLIED